MHVVYLMANNSSVPYFKWFAERAQSEKDIKFSFIALYKERPQMLDDMSQRSCDCYWIKYDDAKRKRGMAFAFFKLLRLFKKIKPDIVHTHLFDDSLPGLLAAKILGIKQRWITKQDAWFHHLYAPSYVKFDRFNNSNATHIHAVSTENKKFLINVEKAPEDKIYLIRNGFPFDIMTKSNEQDINTLKEKYELKGKFVVGTVARLIEWKGHQLIIEAAKELVKKYSDIKFIWAGTGSPEYKALLLKQIHEANLQKHITIADWIERQRMPSLYKTMDMYLHPAINEPFGFAISEALMNGIPIAATQTGSVDLIEHEKSGYVLEMNNVRDIINAVDFYRQDANIKHSIALAGAEHAKEYLIFERMWKEQINSYKKAFA